MGRHSRQKQTRLTFNPVPSSSPAAADYNKQIQDRAAIVSYDGASSSQSGRQPRNKVPSNKSAGTRERTAVNEALPTPGSTLDKRIVEEDSSDNDSEPVRPTQRQSSSAAPVLSPPNLTSSSRPKRSRQQPLDFSRVRDADSFDPPVTLSSIVSSPPNPRSSGMFSSQGKRRRVVDLSSDDDDASDSLPAPDQVLKTPKKSKADKDLKKKDKEEKKKRKEEKKRRNQEKEQRQTRSSQQVVLVDSDDEVITPRARRSFIQLSDQESDDDEEDMPTTTGKKSRKRGAPRSSPPRAVESDDEITIVQSPRKRRRGIDNSDDDEDNAPVTPGRRRLKRRRQITQEEQDDLNEDMDFLEPSSDTEALNRAPRDSQSVKKNARLQALEALKRKRSGQEDEPEVIDEEEDEDDPNDEGSEDGILGHLDENDYDEEDDDTPRIISSRQMFNATQEDDDFIEGDDEDGVLGVPDGMPIEYTRYATMSAKHLFKYAVEWMVQKKINPAFQMTDQLYDLTFKKLNDEVQGLAGSKFRSAAWTPEFTIALQARPEIAWEHLERGLAGEWEHDKCDACNRSGHPATFQLQFSGSPYYPETLEDVANPDDEDSEDPDSDSDSSSSSDNESSANRDAQGRVVLPASTMFYVGKFCMANAATAHALQHWRYHLYDWVETWLTREGYSAPDKIVERDGWKVKKRRRYANKIVDKMERDLVIKELWKGFKENIDNARNSKQGRFERFDSP